MSSTSPPRLVPRRCQPRRAALAALAALALAVACGSDDDADAAAPDDTTTSSEDPGSTTTTTTTTTTAGPTTTTTTATGGGPVDDAAISLDIEVTTEGQPARQASLICSDRAEGTGFLADPQAAAAACELLRTNGDAVRRLVEGRHPDLLCTEIYGGPEVARVRGTVDGRPVDATIDRTDGCGIADWDLLTPLIGSADY